MKAFRDCSYISTQALYKIYTEAYKLALSRYKNLHTVLRFKIIYLSHPDCSMQFEVENYLHARHMGIMVGSMSQQIIFLKTRYDKEQVKAIQEKALLRHDRGYFSMVLLFGSLFFHRSLHRGLAQTWI